ncbi:F0F1 ATP synthase subunit delta [Helicobacter sp. 11S02596-1]|uniref:F0F1 ATP synthase subunit delta n=1 Tax=Helicobacter sp. 11S02596-1 TaxID=1476194 RepID=UPI000BA6AB5F|nr:F0F1 ATP synthase subunit delta [Helicobacter sp. 11S02596-1]PAF44217.1 hypothetical protein BJI48_03275 [Helicobacter sp. 11S02596-1]
MVEIVAKKYTKALIASFDDNHLEAFLKDIEKMVGVFGYEKFLDIIHSPYVSKSHKQAFLLELINSNNEKTINFVKLLGENDRFDIIPSLYAGLQAYMSQKSKSYVGLLYLNQKVDPNVVDRIAKALSGRFGVSLEIKQVENPIEGIKLVIDDLGIEISFSRENFLNELKSYVLKAI